MKVNSEKKLDCTNIFSKEIYILKQYRDIMWTCQGKISFYAYHNFQDLPDSYDKMIVFKEYVSKELFEEFEKEFQMTICLLEKCLITSKNKGEMPKQEEAQAVLENILEKINDAKDDAKSEEVMEALRKEDSTARKALERLGLTEEQINKAIEKGFKVESVLDVEQEKALK